MQEPTPVTRAALTLGDSHSRIVRSTCTQCWNGCGILVHVNNDVVTKVEGDPDNPYNKGIICAKGLVGPQGVYNPYRVKRPLMRAIQEKGLGIDPGWKEISWEEALTIVAERLRTIRSKDPRTLMFSSFDSAGGPMLEYESWTTSFGSPNYTPGSSDFFCGNSVHSMHYLNQASFEGGVDFRYCKYLLQIGTQWGAVINKNLMNTRELADARASKRMKVVVIDPWCSFAGSKADEWIPIRPGTDAALLLSVVNVMINKLQKYDEEFLKLRTNAPYLIGPDKLYARDRRTGKPLVWDSVENTSKPFDDPTVKGYALTGEYNIDGTKCKPGFQLLKEHVGKYTPEEASKITTVPAEKIEKLAREWVEAASIGQTTEIDGQRLPLRPVSLYWYRGASAHKHSATIGYAVMLLPTLVGAIDVPGGAMGYTRMPKEIATEDGLLATENRVSVVRPPYPPHPVTAPTSAFFSELFPIAPYSPVMAPLTQLNKSKYKPPYSVEMLVQVRNNIVKSSGPTDLMERWVKQIPFVVSFSTVLDETAQMSDIVFPDVYYLEREALPKAETHPGITGPFFQYMQHQAVPPPFDPPYDKITSVVDILLELAHRAGFLDHFYDELNSTYNLKEPYSLAHGKRYTWSEIIDGRLKNSYGEQHGLDWFKENQVLSWPKDVKSAYPGAFRKARIHLYYEFIERAGKEVERVTKELRIPWDVSDYNTLPDWSPCPSFNPTRKECDLWIINAKLPTHTLSGSIYFPGLLEVTRRHRLDGGVLMNSKTAASKGISHGDPIVIETESGKKQKATALLSEAVHPEVVVCFGNFGRRALGIPNAPKYGVDFNYLLELDEEHIDFVNGALDSCIRVRVFKEGG